MKEGRQKRWARRERDSKCFFIHAHFLINIKDMEAFFSFTIASASDVNHGLKLAVRY